MELLGPILGVMIGIAIIGLLLGTFFMWLGAKLAGVEDATFGKSFLAALGGVFATWFATWLLSVFPGIGTGIGFIIGLILTIFIIEGAFGIGFGKALVVWIFHFLAQAVAVLIALATFGGVLIQLF